MVLQGRSDEMIIYDGVNIYPSEIERVVSTHPAVKEVAAFSIKHQRFQSVPVVAVVPDSEIKGEEIVKWARDRLGIKGPKTAFMVGELPRSSSGKILRRELARAYSTETS